MAQPDSPSTHCASLAPCVWVVDDDRAVLTAVSRVLRSVGYGVRTFASAELFLAEREHDTAACIVLDLSMPGVTGLELQESLARNRIPASVVFITGHGDVPSSVQAMKAGAVDFLMKPFEAPQLIAAVEAALARSRTVRAAQSERQRITECFSQLTPREREVLGCLIEGKRNKNIAAELGATEKTIKVHRARVQHKMGVRSIAELASCIERAGLRPHLASRAP